MLTEVLRHVDAPISPLLEYLHNPIKTGLQALILMDKVISEIFRLLLDIFNLLQDWLYELLNLLDITSYFLSSWLQLNVLDIFLKLSDVCIKLEFLILHL